LAVFGGERPIGLENTTVNCHVRASEQKLDSPSRFPGRVKDDLGALFLCLARLRFSAPFSDISLI
jgi:hypothetical protein